MIVQEVNYTNNWPSTILRIPSDKVLARVKTTYDHYRKSRPTLNEANGFNSSNFIAGLPDTWQYEGANTEQNNHVLLTPELQWLWYNECVKQWPGQTKAEYDKAFNSLTTGDRWQTNDYGSSKNRSGKFYAVYPTGKNIDKEPMRFFTLLTGNAIIEIVGEPKRVYGTLRYPFRVINANAPLDGITYATHPYLFYKPMNSVRTPIMDSNGKWTGKYIENGYGRFPQFGGNAVTPLYMPHTDVAWIDTNYVEILKPGQEIPEPFNM